MTSPTPPVLQAGVREERFNAAIARLRELVDDTFVWTENGDLAWSARSFDG
jgi:hypothetical protein